MTKMQRHNSLISADMRILLHLLNYHSSISLFDLPFELTQIGIAQNVNIKRGYIHRPLNKLIEEGYIQEGVGHTKCGKRKIKYYFLTDDGKKYARELEKGLSNLSITLKLSNDTLKTMKLKNITPYLEKKKIYQGIIEMDIYTNLKKDGTLDIVSLKNIKKTVR
ncbi:MAG: winged helix-turn-helix transcriptional regulator [Thermoplasmata archaeon]|nr:MAG: winged helix-turn-helix transcriptional regulator [Thermoplasmata archaeon]